ncbi:MBL fold metallo-hydrolase [Roseobacter sp. CCS2]|uniref:MBL fold metallo-hydrolase n=1 Tax=Roseobacter sp. CCS2 TaxID=391593 RepID=UPI0000F3C3EF|nr:metallo-beta-lactamase family protein [Roseobacter sp. CCS2]
MNAPFAPIAGQPLKLADDLALVLAPNPSPMTYLGTNTYVLGCAQLVIIDPGPADSTHLRALERVIAGRPVSHILLTHSHLDHSPLATALSSLTGALVYAYGDSTAGRSAIMAQLAREGLAGGGEGIDRDFKPDRYLQDGEVLTADCGQITAIHTPGHIGNHLSFMWRDAIFTGDHVMGWASSLVSPPDGDLTDFMVSCARLKTCEASVFYPSHGAPIADPKARLAWLVNHRLDREAQILSALSDRPTRIAEITATVYHDVTPGLRAAAARNVFAHLVDLYQKGKVTAHPVLSTTATFVKS